MTKTLTIQIKSLAEALGEFRETFEAVQAGRRVTRRGGVSFTSLEAARNLLTPRRLALLCAIRHKRPGSIYELSKIVGRDLKNVQSDLQILRRYGLIRLSRGRGAGKRKVRVPQAMFGAIQLKIAI
jgi:predicted transcriptional regulator